MERYWKVWEDDYEALSRDQFFHRFFGSSAGEKIAQMRLAEDAARLEKDRRRILRRAERAKEIFSDEHGCPRTHFDTAEEFCRVFGAFLALADGEETTNIIYVDKDQVKAGDGAIPLGLHWIPDMRIRPKMVFTWDRSCGGWNYGVFGETVMEMENFRLGDLMHAYHADVDILGMNGGALSHEGGGKVRFVSFNECN